MLIEEIGEIKATIDIAVKAFLLQSRRINSQFGQKSASFFAVRKRRFNGKTAAIGQQQPAAGTKFIAFGVSAEIIVIVEDQYACGITCLLTIEICGC